VLNLNTGNVEKEINLPGSGDIKDLDFDLTGDRVVISTSDNFVRILHLREESVDFECEPEENKRQMFVRFVTETRFIVVGYKMGNKRCFSVWDIEAGEAIFQHFLDKENNLPHIHVDKYQKLFYFGGHGQTRIRTFEILEDQIFTHRISHLCLEDVFGMTWIKKQYLDVSTVEINRLYRLGKRKIVPVSFQVMRKRKEYFQDDIYKKVFRTSPAMLSADEWFSGADIPDERMSLQPSDMIALSLAPPEKQTVGQKNQRRRQSQALMTKHASSTKSKDDAGKNLLESVTRMGNNQNWAPDIGQWTVTAMKSEVEEDEWSD